MEFADLEAARAEAIKTAGEMLREMNAHLSPETVWEMDVTNEAGRPLLTFRFSTTEHIP